jgi:GDPmannose 4,6-dehydratase
MKKNKIALITGITGQDGSLLAKFLLKKNYIVHGVKRRSSSLNTLRIDDIYQDAQLKNKNFILHYGDMTDSSNITSLVSKIKPNEIYNLAAQSHVKVSFETPEYTANCDAMGPLRILEAIRNCNLEKKTKYYQASTSEMFGTSKPPQSEKTVFQPASPYGSAKLYGYWITKNYRDAYDIFASNGILFNHEGPLRGETFVTKKITIAAAKISKGMQKKLYLGNLNAKRDWGDARDFVEGMWKILQHPKPDDFVLATGKSFTVRRFVELAFKEVNINIRWRGKGLNEVGYNSSNKKTIIEIDKRYFRPNEVDFLQGNYAKSKKLLDWKPKITLNQMIKDMIAHDLKNID